MNLLHGNHVLQTGYLCVGGGGGGEMRCICATLALPRPLKRGTCAEECQRSGQCERGGDGAIDTGTEATVKTLRGES